MITITIPVSQNRLTGIGTSNTVTLLLGKMSGGAFGDAPKLSSIADWSVRRIPSDATSFASGAAVLSGRKTSTSINTPTRAQTSNVTTSAGAVPNVNPKKSVFSDQNEYPATIATAPVARLMIPDPRYVRTTPSARPAISAPVPRPSRANRTTWSMSGPVSPALSISLVPVDRISRYGATHPLGGGTQSPAFLKPFLPT